MITGQTRVTVRAPSDAAVTELWVQVGTDVAPPSTPGTVTKVTATSGQTVTLTLPGPTSRTADHTMHAAAWAAGAGGAAALPPSRLTTLALRTPITLAPSGRDAYGTVFGWETQNRIRSGNTSTNTYRGLWWYGALLAVLGGRTVTKAEVHVYRADGGPGGAMPLDVGTHSYTTRPSGRPTISGVTQKGSVGRNTAAWVDVGTSLGQALSAGTAKGLGVAYDTTDVNRVWVGQSATADGEIRITHTDYAT
jgi:hypothetical protein